jgi:predicted RNase H-like nuclease (RuvC/YqgF family)
MNDRERRDRHQAHDGAAADAVFLQQAVSQLRALQQTVSSDRAEMKRLSDDVTALSAKIEVLQQSFASTQQAPAVQANRAPKIYTLHGSLPSIALWSAFEDDEIIGILD